jgi:hypothetical protein
LVSRGPRGSDADRCEQAREASPAVPRPGGIEGAPGDDPEQPSLNTRSPVELRCAIKGGQKGLLHNILNVWVCRPKNARRVPVELCEVRTIELTD